MEMNSFLYSVSIWFVHICVCERERCKQTLQTIWMGIATHSLLKRTRVQVPPNRHLHVLSAVGPLMDWILTAEHIVHSELENEKNSQIRSRPFPALHGDLES